MSDETVLPNGLTVAEQAAYDAEYADYQYDDASRLTGEEWFEATAKDAAQVRLIALNRARGVITAGEADKKLRDLLAS